MVLKRAWNLCMMCFLVINGSAQSGLKQGAWNGHLYREDGKVISFHFDVKTDNGKAVIYIINANEKIRVDKIRNTKDSVVMEMSVFE